MKLIEKLVCAVCFVGILAVPSALANTNCGVNLKQVTVTGGSSINIHNVACNGDEARLNVRYAWVNLNTASLVMSGVLADELKPLFGDRPQFIDTTVGRDLNAILREYGVRLSGDVFSARDRVPTEPNSRIFGSGGVATVYYSDTTRRLIQRAAETNPTLRYLPMERFPWPNTEEAGRFMSGSRWPRGNYTYSLNLDSSDNIADFSYWRGEVQNPSTAVEETLACIGQFRFIDQAEFRQYWAMSREAALKVQGKQISPYHFLPNDWIYDDGFAVSSLKAGHPSYDALQHFGQYNWPDDFLMSIGVFNRPDGCGGTPGGFTRHVIPRDPFVLLAVVGTEGRPLTVRELAFEVDTQKRLREQVRTGERQTLSFSSQVRISQKSPLIVPLRIELRYDFAAEPFGSLVGESNHANRVYRTLQQVGPVEVGLSEDFESKKQDWLFTRQVSALPRPATASITQRYIYGRALELTTVELQNERIATARAPAAAVLTNYFWEEGSCPFVSFLDANGDRLSRKRILIGASDETKARWETVDIPPGAVQMLIEEIEPEITYLSHVQIKTSGGRILSESSRKIALKPQDGLVFALPDNASTVSLHGYYSLL